MGAGGSKKASYELGVEKNGKMPEVDPTGKWVVESRFGGTKYLTGAGRMEWGEGVDDKIPKEAKKQANAKRSRITEKRKGPKGKAEVNNNADSDSD